MNGLITKKDMFSIVDHAFEDLFNDFFTARSKPAFIDKAKKSIYPKMDIYNASGNLIVEVALPGISKDDVEVEIKDEILTIKGKSVQNKDRTLENYVVKELHKSSFSRSIAIPKDQYDLDSVTATFENGVLNIAIVQREQEKVEDVKKINIV